MAQTVPTSLTRRSMVAGLTLTTAPASALLGGRITRTHRPSKSHPTRVYTIGWAAFLQLRPWWITSVMPS
jgi:hypothetical protein